MKILTPQNYRKIDYITAGFFLYCIMGLILLLTTSFLFKEQTLIRIMVVVACPLIALKPSVISKASYVLHKIYPRLK